MRCFSVRVGKKASRAWPAPTGWCGGVCRSALGRDALPSVFEEHRGHGPLLQGGVVGSVGAPWGAMLSCPCPESIAGMARVYGVAVARAR